MTVMDLGGRAPEGSTAIVLPERNLRITYGQLREEVAAAADAFASAGLRPGQRIAMALPNGIEMIVAVLGAALAGTAAPLNPALRHPEFAYYLADAGAALLILKPGATEDARRAAAELGIPVITAAVDEKGSVAWSSPGTGRRRPQPPADANALLLHTSGTTGRPKRVLLKHRHLAASAEQIARTYQLTPADITLAVMPLFHVHGLIGSTLATLASGGTVVIPGAFNPLSFWRTVREYRPTWYSAVPTLHRLLLARAGERRPEGAEHLRFIRSASEPLPAETMNALEARIGVPVLQAYGMTEAAHQIASNPLPPGRRKPDSVGAGTGVKVGVVNEDGNHQPAGVLGEVVIQGPTVIEAYDNDPEANRASFAGGWFRTGDLGLLDADGDLRLMGRLKEQINRGGEKISPSEVDGVLLQHPAVAQAVCFGVPHTLWGEEVSAALVLSRPAELSDLLAFCRDRLADFKCPKTIHVLDAIPLSATGKIQRRLLREQFSHL